MSRFNFSITEAPSGKVFIVHKSPFTYGQLKDSLRNLDTLLSETSFNPLTDVLRVYTECWASFASIYCYCLLHSITLEISSSPLPNSLIQTDHFHLSPRKKYSLELSSEPGIYISTSGSTGLPKKFLLSYIRLIGSALSIKDYMKTAFDDIHAWSMPFNYVYGLSMLNQTLITFSTAIILDISSQNTSNIDILNTYCPNKLYGVPSSLLPYFKYFSDSLPLSLKTIFTAGGRCSSQLAKRIMDSERSLCVMYGCTEASARLTYLYVDNLEDLSNGCVGYPIDGVKILTSHDPRSPHEIKFISDFSYIGSIVDNTFLASNTNSISTGDLGFLHNNKLYITGRSGRFAKIAGNKVPLSLLESIFLSNPAVSNAYFLSTMSNDDTDIITVFYESITSIETVNLRSLDCYPLYNSLEESHKHFRILLQVAKYIHYENFPLKPNGKTDFSSLHPGHL